jgi:hypothetical protein
MAPKLDLLLDGALVALKGEKMEELLDSHWAGLLELKLDYLSGSH